MEIGHTAFVGCHKLKDVVLPKGIKRIANNTFYECSHINTVFIPEGVTEIGGSAFSCCGISSIIIPLSVEVIGGTAFANSHTPDYNGEVVINYRGSQEQWDAIEKGDIEITEIRNSNGEVVDSEIVEYPFKEPRFCRYNFNYSEE